MATRTDSTPPGGETTQAGSATPRGTNAIEARRARNRTSGGESRPDAGAEAGLVQRGPENTIQLAKRRAKPPEARLQSKQSPDGLREAVSQATSREQGRQQESGEKESPRAHQRLVPEHVRKRFVQVGKHYYFADGARAFSDRGGRLTTPSENTEVIRSLVAIAEARGWNEIMVRGTERFRKDAWFAARLAGLEVRGYRPTEFEQAHLVRTLSRDKGGKTQEASGGESSGFVRRGQPEDDRGKGPQNSGNPARQVRQGGLLTGKLVDHGRATYRHDPREPMSYFVKIETPRGDRTIWGVDLERAMKESLSRAQIGEEVGLRAVRQEAVKVRAHERDTEGKIVAEKDLNTHRNRWIVEKRAFFEARAEAARTLRDTAVDPKQAVKRHPELVGTYLQVHAAELAAKQFRDPQDQQRFMTQVRLALADSVARGEPLPPVRLREKEPERVVGRPRGAGDRQPARARE
jgi:Large polyvalent protein-associated domain 7